MPLTTVNLELGNTNMFQESVQHLLYRVKEQKDTYENQPQFSPSICMAPRKLRDLSPNSFNPEVVSIGPLHREDEKVQNCEGQKARYLINLMNRILIPQEKVLGSCMQKVHDSMKQIKECYVWEKTYSDAEIAEMMVMDACFILEYIYSSKDIRFVSSRVFFDLLLLENQIPFFILDEIFQCTILKFDPVASLVKLILNFLIPLRLLLFEEFDVKINHNISRDSIHHILSILHQCYKPPDFVKPVPIPLTIPSAVDLDSAGVRFKHLQYKNWLMQMKVETHWWSGIFGSWHKPTLRMPRLFVSYDGELVLRNLVAYEQLIQTSGHITSYVVAMAMLVKTQEDVDKLVDSRVLVNYVGSNEEVAHIINNISKEVATRDFFYNLEWETMNKYWKTNIAWFRRTYFKSPWNMTALLAGIVLFALTVVQTIYAIKSAK